MRPSLGSYTGYYENGDVVDTGVGAVEDYNKQIEYQNALLESQYEWEKAKEAPAVAGASLALQGGHYTDAAGNQITKEAYAALSDEEKANYQWNSQFQGFVDQAGQIATGAGSIAEQYLYNVPYGTKKRDFRAYASTKTSRL